MAAEDLAAQEQRLHKELTELSADKAWDRIAKHDGPPSIRMRTILACVMAYHLARDGGDADKPGPVAAPELE